MSNIYKVGLVADSIRDNSVGTGYYAKGFFEALLKTDKKNKYYFIDYKETEYNKNNLILIKNPFKKLKTYLWHLFLPLRLKKHGLDFIINVSSGPFLFSLGQKITPVIYDLTLDLFPQTHPFNRVLFNKLFLRNTLNKSYKIIVPSESTKRDLIKYYSIPENKIVVIFIPIKYAPVKLSKVGKKVKFSFPYILNINTIEPRKNISVLIKAFSGLKKENHIPHKLVICGELGWKYESILDLVKNLKLDKEIIFMGYVSEEEKKYLYTKADVFVYPSLYEGFGIPVLEAQIYGCPVVASNVSSIPEVLGDGGIKINPYKVDEIKKGILKVISNNELREKLIKMGIKQSRKYTDGSFIKTKIEKLTDFMYAN